jgi:hypothetical protein
LLFTARERVGGGDCKFSLALFDAAWKATIGDKEIGGLLKVADGAEKSVEGAALRREFRGYIRHQQWERIEWFSTMQDARSLPKVAGDKLNTADLLKFCQKHLQLLISEEFWKSTLVNNFYAEYFSVLASTAALSDIRLKLDSKVGITAEDITLVEKTMKLRGAVQLNIDLNQSNSKIFAELCAKVASYYIDNQDMNLSNGLRVKLRAELTEAGDAKGSEEDPDAGRAEATFSVMQHIFKTMVGDPNLGFGQEEFLKSMEDAYDLSTKATT